MTKLIQETTLLKHTKFRRFVLLFLVIILSGTAGWAQSFTMITWNIQDLGQSKEEAEIDAIVQILRTADLVLIQEVVGKDPAGAQKVAAIADGLNRTGARWDYRISDRTQSPSPYISERYAILWKPSKLQLLGRAILDQELAEECDREPYLARFKVSGDTSRFWVANFHARKHDKEPEEEIRHFISYPQRLGTDAVIIAGDFNLDEQHQVWSPFYSAGFVSALEETPTTLKRSCNRRGEYFNYAIDNIFFMRARFAVSDAMRIDFVERCELLETARGISDHLPVKATITMRP